MSEPTNIVPGAAPDLMRERAAVESPAVELQGLIYAVLTGDAAMMALIHDVYDFVPEPRPDLAGETDRPWGSMQGYISFGPLDVINDDSECLVSGLYTFQLDVWSRQRNSLHCRRIIDRARALFDQQSFDLPTNALVGTTIKHWRQFRDPDGLTTHGIISLETTIEDGAG
jgi:hypothetical protein